MGFVVKAVKSVAKAVIGVVKGVFKVVGMVLGFVKPKGNAANDATDKRLSKRLEPEDFRKIIFGKTALAVDLRYWEIHGSKNTDYSEVIAGAGHEIEGFDDFYIEDDKVTFSGNVSTGKFAGALTKTTNTGAPGNAALAVGSGSYWNATSTFTGVAHYALAWKAGDEEKLPNGVPSRYTHVARGARVYDPRLDSTRGGSGSHRVDDQSTWSYATLDGNGQPIGRNNALQMLWYLIGWKIEDPATGEKHLVAGRGVEPSDINWPDFIAAANDAEALELYTDMILSTGDDHSQNESIISADGLCGELLDPGGLWTYKIIRDDTADVAVDLEEDDIAEGEVSWNPQARLSDIFNEVAGTYIDPSETSLYQSKAYPTVKDQAYVTEDGYRKRTSHNFQNVQDPELAQRLARIKLNRTRFTGEFVATFKFKALKATVWSIVSLTSPRWGMTTKLFRVLSQSVSDEGIQMTLREEHPSIYAAGTVTVPPAPSAMAKYDIHQKVAITNLTTVAATSTSGNSTAVGIRAAWDELPGNVRETEVEYRVTGTSDWVAAGKATRGQMGLSIFPLLNQTSYDVRARTISIHRVPGDWQTSTATTSNTAIDVSELVGLGGLATKDAVDLNDLNQTEGKLPTSRADAGLVNTSITVSGGGITGIGAGNGTTIANDYISVSGNNITGIGIGNGTAVDNLGLSITDSGALVGGNGGQVTIGGLGYTGDLDAHRLNRLTILNGKLWSDAVGNHNSDHVANSYVTNYANQLSRDGGVTGTGIYVVNGGVSINAQGALVGGGGGQVTISGLGYSGDLNATYGAHWRDSLVGRPVLEDRSYDMGYVDTDAMAVDWTISPPSNVTMVQADSSSGRVAEVGDNAGNDYTSFFAQEEIPYDPNALYEVTWDIEIIAGSNGGKLYAGLAGTDKAGNNLGGSYNYCCFSYFDVATNVGRHTRKAYIKGLGPVNSASGNPAGTPSAPALMPDGSAQSHGSGGVVKIKPMALINHPSGAGKVRIHNVRIRKLEGAMAAVDTVDLSGDYASGTLPVERADAGLVNTSITVSGGGITGIGAGNGTTIANDYISVSGNNITGIGIGNGTAVDNLGLSITDSGALVGGNGGQVTIGGLGYAGSLSATDDLGLTEVMGSGLATINGNSVTKGNTSGWDSLVASKKLAGSVKVRAVVNATSTYAMVGLGDGVSTPAWSYGRMKYALYVENVNYKIFENGDYLTTLGSASVGDTVEVEYLQDKVKYWINGESVYTTTGVATDQKLRAEVAVHDPDVTPFKNISFTPSADDGKILGVADQATNDRITTDALNTDRAPSWYRANHPLRKVTETKDGYYLGIPGYAGAGFYGVLETITDWESEAGGKVKQSFTIGAIAGIGKVYRRVSTNESTWGAWQKDYSEFTKPKLGGDLLDSGDNVLTDTGAEGVKNAGVSINEAGALAGGGGGQVTIGGLGYAGSLTATDDLALKETFGSGLTTIKGNTYVHSGGWNSVISSAYRTGNMVARAIVGDAAGVTFFGLDDGTETSTTSFVRINYAVYHNGSAYSFWTAGNPGPTIGGTAATGDVIEMEYLQEKLLVRINGVIVHTVLNVGADRRFRLSVAPNSFTDLTHLTLSNTSDHLKTAGITWFEPAGADLYIETANTVSKRSPGTNSWNGNVYSKESYAGGAVFEGRMITAGTMIGLSTTQANNNYAELRGAWHYDGNQWFIFEWGSQVWYGPSFGGYTFSTDTVFRVVYDGTALLYYAGSTLVRTKALVLPVTTPWFAGVAIASPTNTVTDLKFSPISGELGSTLGAKTGTNLKDSLGNVLTDTGASGVKNADMSLGSNGVFSGGGGGQVTPTGMGLEDGADVTKTVSGPSEMTLNYDSQGTLTTPLPSSSGAQFKLTPAGGASFTSGVTWAVVIASGSFAGAAPSMSGTGYGALAINSNMTSGEATLSVTPTYAGKTYPPISVKVKKVTAAASQSGGGGGAGGFAKDTSLSNFSTSTPIAVSDPLVVATGSASTSVALTAANLELWGQAAAPAGTFNCAFKWQWRVPAGTWADVAAEVNSDPDPTVEYDPEFGGYMAWQSGSATCNVTKTGLAASTTYEFRLMARVTGSTKQITIIGEASAQG